MAQTTALAIGSTDADSSDFTVSAGTPVTVGMMGQAGPNAFVYVTAKAPDGSYQKVGVLDNDRPVQVLDGPGTYRMTRKAGVTCGAWYE